MQIEAGAEREGVAVAGVAGVAGTMTDEAPDLHHPDTEAGTDSVNPHLGANSILMCRLAVTELTVCPDLLVLDLGLDLDPPPVLPPVPRPVDTETNDAIPPGAAAVPTADRQPPIDEAIEEEDGVRNIVMVIQIDTLADMQRAHQLPEGPPAEHALSPAA